jgi:hypothetical protein
MAGKLSRIQRGQRVLTDEEVRERAALILPAGALGPEISKISGKDLGRALPEEMVTRHTRTCTGCRVSFTETVIHPPDEAPKPRDPDERPDLCANCFKKLNRFPLIGATRPRGHDVPRQI